MRREMVTLETERTDPDLSGEVDATERVESGGACFATERSVRETRDVGRRTDQRNCGGEWDDAFAGFYFGAWPNVPCHANSVDTFGICAGDFRHGCCCFRLECVIKNDLISDLRTIEID
jgi:hypothetical protein